MTAGWTRACIWVLVGGTLLVLGPVLPAGDLEPSAPPGSTMKTLDEVEPRIPIGQSDIPKTIDVSGSYYLSEDVSAVGTAITVTVDDVTIDLMGYSIAGPDSGTNYGIYMSDRKNVEIRNGTVRDFYYGIAELSSTARQHRVVNVRAMSNLGDGIRLKGYGHVARECTAGENGGDGIYTGYACTVGTNTAYDNGGIGVYANSGSTVRANTVRENGGLGIDAGGSCTVTANTAYSNDDTGITAGAGSTVSNNTASQNDGDGVSTFGHGIEAGAGALVSGNTASYNYGDGVNVSGYCKVMNNSCFFNGNGGDGAGIHATGSYNTIENNKVIHGDRGLDIDGSGNEVAQNMARDNSDNYDIAADNQIHILLCEAPETIEWPAMVTLAGAVTVTSTSANGITVNADNVSIDLAGHALIGPGSGSGHGVYMDGRKNVTIKNGTVRDFGADGIRENSDASGAEHRVVKVQALSNGAVGLYVGGTGHLVQNCTASGNAGNGIHIGDTSLVSTNIAHLNGGEGIGAEIGCTVTGNTSGYNGSYGIGVSSSCTVSNNTCTQNTGDGIHVVSKCVVVGNTCTSNGYDTGVGAGIYAIAGHNRIEGNHVIDNDRGIDTATGANLVVKNSAAGNTTNYDILAGNLTGALSSDPATAGPWDNFDF